ncbi:plasmid replication initiator protein [Parafrankia soli]|uniref:Plasmid replication initiator protein n=2 Tax=Parafrankia soli TaxID=2599596 RepID=A0A1S1QQ50_9ACTN|nr:plasmid replication initiator protein [Parafrankia soli]
MLPESLTAMRERVADGTLSAFLSQLDRVAGCTNPIRLAGTVDHVDTSTGEMRRVLDTQTMPDGTLLVPCGNRRASVCPSCSYLYKGDAWQIVHAGLTGGPDVPASVAAHPGLFVTLTAPSFGPVHSRDKHGPPRTCHPRGRKRCPHGRPAGCNRIHGDGDSLLGQAICPECFDYPAAVVWNACVSRLWKRTVDLTYRKIAAYVGASEWSVRRALRLSYVKVAEMQARGLVHLHVILRLDQGSTRDGEWISPPEWATGELVSRCLRRAAEEVRFPCPDPHQHDPVTLEQALATLAGAGLVDVSAGTGPIPVADGEARWGEQLDIKRIDVETGDLTPATVGNYLAKYITKSTTDSGKLDRRIRDGEELTALLPFLTAHQAALVKAAWRLGIWPEFDDLRLHAHAHEFGFRGHWLTKSRRYSTTFTRRRQARRTWQRTHTPAGEERVPLDAFGRPDDSDETVIVASWRFHSVGYRRDGDRWLALQAADLARSRREEAHLARNAA